MPIQHNKQRPDIVLYQPDIPGNTGTILRLAACLDLCLHIIEPAGFRLDDKSLKRAGMDYVELAALQKHGDWDAFQTWRLAEKRRLILLTTKTDKAYTGFEYQSGDCLMFGRESAGVPEGIANVADELLTIPMVDGARSLNLAMSVAMVAGEAVRQMG